MSGRSQRSLAFWREAHGFGILDINGPTGEHFLVEAKIAPEPAGPGVESWVCMSESSLRKYLAERGFSSDDADDAIHLSRQWATTITNASFFPPARMSRASATARA